MENSFPAGFRRRMDALLGSAASDFYEGYTLPLRRGMRANPLKCSPERLLALFPGKLTPSPFALDSFYLDDPVFRAGADPLHHAGAYYMQEPSASSAVTLLAPRPGERVLDLCAAPGGKSTQIAAALQGEGLLWSNEYVRARAQILLQNLERCGVRNAVVSSRDAPSLCAGLSGFFDAALVDAPCSGEGMFRKEPAALEQWSEENIRLCAARQEEILWAAAGAVVPGGRLVYSTCTFAPEENECLIARFLAAHPDYELLDAALPFGRPGFSREIVRSFSPDLPDPGVPLERCRRILPGDGGEGHFLALLRRREVPSEESLVGKSPAGEFPALLQPEGIHIQSGKNGGTPGRRIRLGQKGARESLGLREAKTKKGAKRLNSSPTMDTYSIQFQELYNLCFSESLWGEPTPVNDILRLLPAGLPPLAGLGVLAAGVAAAELLPGRLEPCHALFMASQAEDCRSLLDLSRGDPRLTAFLRGETVNAPGCSGWTAVAVEGVVTGFGKAVGGTLKNRYPKGLRLRG